MGEQVKKHLFQPKDVIRTCSSSGELTTFVVAYWRDNCFLPLIDAKYLLLSDSYPGQSHKEIYEPQKCDGKKVTRLQIPLNTTDELQSLHCYFNRRIKNFLGACYNRVALDDLDIHLHQRNNTTQMISLLHNQWSADVVLLVIEYSWFASSLTKDDPSLFQNGNDICFPKPRVHEQCQEKNCDVTMFSPLSC